MKTVFKKMLSLALAALLLVSSVPFQASATETEEVSVPDETIVDVVPQATSFAAYVYVREKGNESNVLAEGNAAVVNNEVSYDSLIAFIPANTETTTYTIGKVRMPNDGGKIVKPGSSVALTADTVFNVFVTITTAEPTTQPTTTPTTEPPVADPVYTIVKLMVDGEVYTTVEYDENDVIVGKLPNGPKKNGKTFEGWWSKEKGQGIQLVADMGEFKMSDTYYAYYTDNTDDGLSTLTVKAVYYVNGTEKGRATVYTEIMDENTENVLTHLAKVETSIWENVDAKAPEIFDMNHSSWNGKYYNSTLSTAYTSQSLDMSADRTVYIKIESTIEAPVTLEIHRSVSNTASKTVWLTGYLAGDSVSLAEAIKVAKEYYTFSSKNAKMYTDEEWQDLVDNDKAATTTEHVYVASNTKTTKVHLYLTSSSSGSSTADTSNPKTGDTIYMAVTVMALSATALAAAYIFNKKRAIH